MTKAQSYTVFNPYIWSPRVTEYFKEKLLFGKFFNALSAEARTEGSRIYVPALATRFTISDINTTSGEITATDVSETEFYLNVNNWKGGGFYLTKFQEAQMRKSYAAQDRYMQGLSHDLAKTLDTALWTYTSATQISKSVGDSATSILATSLEKAISIAESDSLPIESMAFFFHPKAWYKEVLANSDLRKAADYGETVLNRLIFKKNIYGIPVGITPQVSVGAAGTEGASGHRNALIHPEAICFAVQTPIGIEELKGEAKRILVAGDMIYGLKQLRTDAGVRIISKG